MRPYQIQPSDWRAALKVALKKAEKELTPEVPKIQVNVLNFLKQPERNTCTIQFTDKARAQIHALVELTDKEVGWRGVVERVGGGKYIIREILVYPQEATAATVNATDGLGPWLMSQPDEIFDNLRMQGHSHVNMGAHPSGVDEAFYDKMLSGLQDYYIFMIVNKRKELYARVYDVIDNVIYDNADIAHNYKTTPYAAWATKQLEEQVKHNTNAYRTTGTPTSTRTDAPHIIGMARDWAYLDKDYTIADAKAMIYNAILLDPSLELFKEMENALVQEDVATMIMIASSIEEQQAAQDAKKRMEVSS